MGRQRRPEHRLVIGRIGVALAAAAGNHRRVPFGRDVLRALEHQVLEQVRKPGPARLLVLRPDVIPQLHVHDRRRVVFRQHDRQPVGQRRELILKLGRRNGGRRRQAGEGEQCPLPAGLQRAVAGMKKPWRDYPPSRSCRLATIALSIERTRKPTMNHRCAVKSSGSASNRRSNPAKNSAVPASPAIRMPPSANPPACVPREATEGSTSITCPTACAKMPNRGASCRRTVTSALPEPLVIDIHTLRGPTHLAHEIDRQVP